VSLPTLAQAFDASFQQVQWVVIAYLVAITTVIASVGRLGDMTGRRRLLLIGVGLFTVASVLCGVAHTLWLLIAGRAAQGLGAAIMMALTMAFVGETVPKSQVGSAMGLLGTMSAIGTALGPSLGGMLISEFGWQTIFLINLPLGLLIFLLAHRFLPVDPSRQEVDRVGFDHAGTLLLALTLAAYTLAMTIGRGSFGTHNMALLAVALLGAGLFLLVEARTEAPLIRLTMFRNPLLSASLTMSALVSTVMMATLVVGPFYLSRTLGLNAALIGLVLSVGPLFAALTGVPAGSPCGPPWPSTDDRPWASRNSHRCLPPVRHTGDARGLRLHGPPHGHHRRLCAVSDSQQYCRHDEYSPGGAGRRVRPAQPVPQSRADHRGFRHGGCVRGRGIDHRRHDGASRCRRHRDANHVRSRGGSDPPRARRRRGNLSP
jgi:MFS family permease